MHCAVQWETVLHGNSLLYSAVQCSAVEDSPAIKAWLRCLDLHDLRPALHYTLHCTTLYTTLHATLHTTLHTPLHTALHTTLHTHCMLHCTLHCTPTARCTTHYIVNWTILHPSHCTLNRVMTSLGHFFSMICAFSWWRNLPKVSEGFRGSNSKAYPQL